MHLDLLFNSNRLNLSEVRSHFINPICFGEDVAAWLRSRRIERGVPTIEPGQEDWVTSHRPNKRMQPTHQRQVMRDVKPLKQPLRLVWDLAPFRTIIMHTSYANRCSVVRSDSCLPTTRWSRADGTGHTKLCHVAAT
jgi:hypothetical protein